MYFVIVLLKSLFIWWLRRVCAGFIRGIWLWEFILTSLIRGVFRKFFREGFWIFSEQNLINWKEIPKEGGWGFNPQNLSLNTLLTGMLVTQGWLGGFVSLWLHWKSPENAPLIPSKCHHSKGLVPKIYGSVQYYI